MNNNEGQKISKLCVGLISGAHGIRGQVRLRSFTDDPESIFDYKPLMSEDGEREFKLEPKGINKDQFIVEVEGVADRNGAEALRGTKLFVERLKLPKPKKNQYYDADLIGLAAKDGQGKDYGKILAVHNYGAGPFLEIGTNKKDSFMLPFTDACVPGVDVAGGFALIAPPEGWLDKNEEEGGAES
jgi:16S rRNA processing protein RimM